MWRDVSYSALYWQAALVKPGTFRPWRNLASPILLVRAWVSSALSIFRALRGALAFVLLVVCL